MEENVKVNNTHLYEYFIALIFCLLLIISILGFKLYKKDGLNEVTISNEITKSNENEKFLNTIINSHFNTIVKLKNSNDSLIKINDSVNKSRIINYNNYQNEIKRNKKISNITDANIAIDSILHTNGYR